MVVSLSKEAVNQTQMTPQTSEDFSRISPSDNVGTCCWVHSFYGSVSQTWLHIRTPILKKILMLRPLPQRF